MMGFLMLYIYCKELSTKGGGHVGSGKVVMCHKVDVTKALTE